MIRVNIVFEVADEDDIFATLKKLPYKVRNQLDRSPALCDHPEADDQLRGTVGQVIGRVDVSHTPTWETRARALVEAFRDAAVDINEAWPDYAGSPMAVALSEGYPFEEGFVDIVDNICKWVSAQKRK